jgi:hypothetical protein
MHDLFLFFSKAMSKDFYCFSFFIICLLLDHSLYMILSIIVSNHYLTGLFQMISNFLEIVKAVLQFSIMNY